MRVEVSYINYVLEQYYREEEIAQIMAENELETYDDYIEWDLEQIEYARSRFEDLEA